MSDQPDADDVRPVLDVAGLTVRLHGDRSADLVHGVDLRVRRGELMALLGESGSGKSLTARAIIGLTDSTMDVHADRMRLGDTDLLALSEEERRRIRGPRIGLVLQDALSALNPVLSIGDQLREIFRAHTTYDRKKVAQRSVELLSAVGIPDPARRLGEYPHQLSGGMRQRVLIAMAIALEPELLIADEPTTALDVTVQAQILELLDDLRSRLGMSVLLITHDLGVVCEVADRVTVMYAGAAIERGDADQVFAEAAHPYTAALLRAVPQAAQKGSDLLTIPGAPPSPFHVPAGCAFHPRCEMAVEICRGTTPPTVVLAEGRTSSCHRVEDLIHVR